MRTFVLSVRAEGRPAHYVVDVDIDGEVKHFTMLVEPSGDGVCPYDREFEVIRRQRLVLADVVDIVLRYHEGREVQFPIDLHKWPD